MFHPNAPNFLLSCTKAWKKVKEKTKRFHSLGLLHVSKFMAAGTSSKLSPGTTWSNDRSMLFLNPFGGCGEDEILTFFNKLIKKSAKKKLKKRKKKKTQLFQQDNAPRLSF